MGALVRASMVQGEQLKLELYTTREATELQVHCKRKNAFLSVW